MLEKKIVIALLSFLIFFSISINPESAYGESDLVVSVDRKVYEMAIWRLGDNHNQEQEPTSSCHIQL